jgi:glycosyltransferase involved in cell wall biosynthesis
MKILFLTHWFYPKIGGIEVNSEILADGFRKNGHEVRLMTWTEDSGGKNFAYPVIRKPEIGQLIRAHLWADVVFENNLCLRLSWPAVFFKKKSVVALSSWMRRDNGQLGWQDKLKTLWLKRARGVIAVSKVLRDECWPEAKVIGNPYRNDLFRQTPNGTQSKGFVFLGRLVGDKGADLAIRALAVLMNSAVAEDLPWSMVLTVVGEGPEYLNLQQLAIDLGIAPSVIFKGTLTGEALVETLNEHRYILVPSTLIEPFGNVALEGMACGCLPIVSDSGGLPDAVGNAGLTFKRASLDELVKTILDLLERPELEKELREQAVFQLKDHLPEVVSKRYLEVIGKAFREN